MQGSVPNCPPGSTTPATKRIKVRVDMDQNGPCWNYAIEADDKASDPYVKAGNKIDLPNPTPKTVIEFRLQGKLGKKLDFDQADPIWVLANTCPTTGSNDPDICLISCTADKLEILDLNSKQVDLHYRLNFVDSAGQKLNWDPIIKNGGGGP